jgi:hypothetical protein
MFAVGDMAPSKDRRSVEVRRSDEPSNAVIVERSVDLEIRTDTYGVKDRRDGGGGGDSDNDGYGGGGGGGGSGGGGKENGGDKKDQDKDHDRDKGSSGGGNNAPPPATSITFELPPPPPPPSNVIPSTIIAATSTATATATATTTVQAPAVATTKSVISIIETTSVVTSIQMSTKTTYIPLLTANPALPTGDLTFPPGDFTSQPRKGVDTPRPDFTPDLPALGSSTVLATITETTSFATGTALADTDGSNNNNNDSDSGSHHGDKKDKPPAGQLSPDAEHALIAVGSIGMPLSPAPCKLRCTVPVTYTYTQAHSFLSASWCGSSTEPSRSLKEDGATLTRVVYVSRGGETKMAASGTRVACTWAMKALRSTKRATTTLCRMQASTEAISRHRED